MQLALDKKSLNIFALCMICRILQWQQEPFYRLNHLHFLHNEKEQEIFSFPWCKEFLIDRKL